MSRTTIDLWHRNTEHWWQRPMALACYTATFYPRTHNPQTCPTCEWRRDEDRRRREGNPFTRPLGAR